MTQPGGVAAVGKAAQILLSFTAVRPCQSLRQIEARTGIPRATAHGICLTLVAAGFLEVVPNRGYQLGSAFVGLGGQVIERTGLLDAAKDVGKRLLHLDNAEAHLAQLVGGWMVYLDRTSSNFKLPMNAHIGSRQLAYTTDAGLAALALMRPDDMWRVVQAACRNDGRDPPDRLRLLEELTLIRRTGYGLVEQSKLGRTSVGVAIVNASGWPVGGVSISGPSELFAGHDSLTRVARLLQTMATTISRRLPPSLG